jgi:hypothetical protein
MRAFASDRIEGPVDICETDLRTVGELDLFDLPRRDFTGLGYALEFRHLSTPLRLR